jgi:hypothetical protein
MVIAPMGCRRGPFTSRARATMASVIARLSFTGFVLGMAQTWAKPPAAAARGRRRCLPCTPARLAQVRVQIDEGRDDPRAAPVDDRSLRSERSSSSVAAPGPSRVIRPPSMTTSTTPSSAWRRW